MTLDLWMLVASAGLQWALILLVATPKILTYGPKWAMGNRDGDDKPAVWVARADRANKNLAENLPLFAILVLVAHVSGGADSLSQTGAITFLGARVAHAILYVAGIPAARTLSWVVSVVGMGMIVASLFNG